MIGKKYMRKLWKKGTDSSAMGTLPFCSERINQKKGKATF
jgi:hypothetical protein